MFFHTSALQSANTANNNWYYGITMEKYYAAMILSSGFYDRQTLWFVEQCIKWLEKKEILLSPNKVEKEGRKLVICGAMPTQNQHVQ